MSAAIAFDTHRFVKNLTASGFTEAQAEALAREQIHLLETNLATKSDLAAVKAGLKSCLGPELDTFSTGIKLELDKLKFDLMYWWVVGLTIHAALFTALLQLLV